MRTTAKHTDHPVRVGPDDMSALAFALNESFDVLDLLYLEQDGVTPSAPRNDQSVCAIQYRTADLQKSPIGHSEPMPVSRSVGEELRMIFLDVNLKLRSEKHDGIPRTEAR